MSFIYFSKSFCKHFTNVVLILIICFSNLLPCLVYSYPESGTSFTFPIVSHSSRSNNGRSITKTPKAESSASKIVDSAPDVEIVESHEVAEEDVISDDVDGEKSYPKKSVYAKFSMLSDNEEKLKHPISRPQWAFRHPDKLWYEMGIREVPKVATLNYLRELRRNFMRKNQNEKMKYGVNADIIEHYNSQL